MSAIYDKDNSSIIIDVGSSTCRAGFGGDDAPYVVFPTIAGRPKSESDSEECYVGDKAQSQREMLSISYPVKRGIVDNWEDMEKIMHHIYSKLEVPSNEHIALLTETALNPKEDSERMAQMMFETFNVPGFNFGTQATLSFYSTCLTHGIYLDCGDGVTQVVPVSDEKHIPAGIERIELAGSDVTQYLQKLICDKGYSIDATADMDSIRDIKEKHGFTALDFETEMSSTSEGSYVLPDGREIAISNERFKCTEVLFQPSLNGLELSGIHEVLHKSIMNCPSDLREALCQNIVVSGGASMSPNFPERIKKEISALFPSFNDINVIAEPNRDNFMWMSATVLGNLSKFDSMLISKQEYDEYGPTIVHTKKCW